jgi:hypothetical protein
MNNLKAILSITLLISSLTFIGYISNSVIAIPSDLRNHEYVFGPLVGVTSNNTGNVDWVLSGTWRSTLSNDTVSSTNENVSQSNQSSGVFKAAIEMIKPDGTGRHTHALTNFVVMNAIQNADSNSTTFNGTSTISLRDGPAIDIPTTIERSANGNVFIITIDPESVDYHFGKSPLIYGITANPAFMKTAHL